MVPNCCERHNIVRWQVLLDTVQSQILTGLYTTTNLFSNYHVPYTHNMLHHVNSYYFKKYMKLFQTGTFIFHIRPDMLYFSIWGLCKKDEWKRNLWPVKTPKPWCKPSRRFVWLHPTKSSVILVALTVKGQKYWTPLVDPCILPIWI